MMDNLRCLLCDSYIRCIQDTPRRRCHVESTSSTDVCRSTWR